MTRTVTRQSRLRAIPGSVTKAIRLVKLHSWQVWIPIRSHKLSKCYLRIASILRCTAHFSMTIQINSKPLWESCLTWTAIVWTFITLLSIQESSQSLSLWLVTIVPISVESSITKSTSVISKDYQLLRNLPQCFNLSGFLLPNSCRIPCSAHNKWVPLPFQWTNAARLRAWSAATTAVVTITPSRLCKGNIQLRTVMLLIVISGSLTHGLELIQIIRRPVLRRNLTNEPSLSNLSRHFNRILLLERRKEPNLRSECPRCVEVRLTANHCLSGSDRID